MKNMATIKDVAKHAGLSMATVSKYLNGIKVQERNKISIDTAIAELGYSVNELDRGLRTGQSNIIGVVIPELSGIFTTTILSYTDDILFERGYSLIVGDCRSKIEREARSLQVLLSRQVDGIINMPSDMNGKHLLPAIDKNIPVVLIERMISSLEGKVNAVLVDNVTASMQATQLLIDAGHIDIGIILGPQHIISFQQRFQGYKQAFEKNNIELKPELIRFSGRSNIQSGYLKTIELINECKPTALFVTNHYMTLGVTMALGDMRMSIPQDISLVAYDDLPASRVIKPKLTLVAQPLEEIAHSIADIILAAIENKRENKSPEAVVKLLKAEIQIGDSV